MQIGAPAENADLVGHGMLPSTFKVSPPVDNPEMMELASPVN